MKDGTTSSLAALIMSGDDPAGKAIVVFVLMSTVAVIMAVALYLRMRANHRKRFDTEGFDRMGAVLGRLERLEQNLNEFHTEVGRSLEFVRSDLACLRDEVGGGRTLPSSSMPGSVRSREASLNVAPSPSSTSREGGVSRVPSGLKLDDVESAAQEEEPPGESSDTDEVRVSRPDNVQKTVSSVDPSQPLIKELVKSRKGFFAKLKGLFTRKPTIDEGMIEELEALLVGSDLGVRTVQSLIDDVKNEVKESKELSERAFIAILKLKVLRLLEEGAPINPAISPKKRTDGPHVVLMVGVNGVGKTTTTAKLASQLKQQGLSVLMIAADTFRAAAVDQLVEWGVKTGVPVVSGKPEEKPSTVVVEGMQQALAKNVDVVLIDTAGRLHNKSHLLQELEGINNACQKVQASAPHDVILVLDGATGVNGLSQATEFNGAVKLSGLIVTKLDGTPKGGIVVAIKSELGVPVRYIGVGEGLSDLRPFVAQEFVDALFETGDLENSPSDNGSAHAEQRRRRRREGELSV